MKVLRPILLLAMLICASIGHSQIVPFGRILRSTNSPFLIEYSGTKDKANGFITIRSIGIRHGGKTLQTIHLSGDDVPRVRDLRGAIQLRDINCDGYKDLLVEFSTGVHGDSWYHLYLFNPNTERFVQYQQFSELPFKQVVCRTKEVTTYVNSGQAGCAYESGLYRWVNDELKPIRIESQQGTDGKWTTFTRTIRTWTGGKESKRTLKIAGDDCHR